MEQIEKVWDIKEPGEEPGDEATEEEKAKWVAFKAECDFQLEILLWYLDCFLPHAAGLEFWGPNIRPFHLMTDKLDVPGDKSGKKKVYVTITSEAFGLVVYANCRDKWIADFTLRATNKRAKIPKYNKDDPATFKHQNKWSCSRSGQVIGGGWHNDALVYMNTQMKAISKWRKEEAERGNVNYMMGRELIRKAQSVTMGQEDETKKKRKRASEKAADSALVEIDLDFIDE